VRGRSWKLGLRGFTAELCGVGVVCSWCMYGLSLLGGSNRGVDCNCGGWIKLWVDFHYHIEFRDGLYIVVNENK
jgi:hypothetical protein